MVDAIVGLGNALSVDIVAKGVEERAEAETLFSLGCEKMQGFHFAPSMSNNALIAWLENFTKNQDDCLD